MEFCHKILTSSWLVYELHEEQCHMLQMKLNREHFKIGKWNWLKKLLNL